jgi:hypothetical protein
MTVDSRSRPLVLLIDLDNTIIGNSTMQVCRYEIAKQLNVKVPRGSMVSDLTNGLIRPHFESFFKMLAVHYPRAECFIYTAAERKWASFVITCIEQIVSTKFNRPIFSREHCVTENGIMMKSISKVLPIIQKKLAPKYPGMKLEDMWAQTLFIDNNHVCVRQDLHRFLKCPSYEYMVPTNIIAPFPQKLINKGYNECGLAMKKYGVLPTYDANVITSSDSFFALYYGALSDVYQNCSSGSNQRKLKTDQFWLTMEQVFTAHRIKHFNVKVIAYISRKTQKSSSKSVIA